MNHTAPLAAFTAVTLAAAVLMAANRGDSHATPTHAVAACAAPVGGF